jgi:tRNA pseudouridine38-40 synthase
MCQSASPVKTLDEIVIEQREYPSGTEYRFSLRARSFLHNQVRSIVGTLERVGALTWQPDRVAEVLEARDRAACGPVCPPQGLYLTGVVYPTNPFLQA